MSSYFLFTICAPFIGLLANVAMILSIVELLRTSEIGWPKNHSLRKIFDKSIYPLIAIIPVLVIGFLFANYEANKKDYGQRKELLTEARLAVSGL
ncbi:MAG: hypothetical protein HQK51_18400, partial [Oligoflexia bacterium]|nr:hypothetical protein [Oligoflexia bacterium]